MYLSWTNLYNCHIAECEIQWSVTDLGFGGDGGDDTFAVEFGRVVLREVGRRNIRAARLVVDNAAHVGNHRICGWVVGQRLSAGSKSTA